MQILYLSLKELAKAIYYHRVKTDDLRLGYYCFVYDDKTLLGKGVAGVKDLLRQDCILVDAQCAETYRILKTELGKAEHKRKVAWRDSQSQDPWAGLNQMLRSQGFGPVDTTRPYSLRAVSDEVKAAHLPLRPVIVPEYEEDKDAQ